MNGPDSAHPHSKDHSRHLDHLQWITLINSLNIYYYLLLGVKSELAIAIIGSS